MSKPMKAVMLTPERFEELKLAEENSQLQDAVIGRYKRLIDQLLERNGELSDANEQLEQANNDLFDQNIELQAEVEYVSQCNEEISLCERAADREVVRLRELLKEIEHMASDV